MSIKTMSEFDSGQITRLGFDDEQKAHRMILVNQPAFNILNSNAAAPFSNAGETRIQIERIEVPFPVKEIEIREIQVPLIVKEFQIVEVEKPVYIDKIVYVDKPFIVKEGSNTNSNTTEVKIVEKDLPKMIKVVLTAQLIITILMLFKK